MHPTLSLMNALLCPNNEAMRWVCLRHLLVAPLTEEIVFSVCMVPVLESTDMSALRVSLMAPLFFGVAHVHHACLKLREGKNQWTHVLLATIFQFAYTSIFGAFASYAFIKTRSLLAVTICHAFCNGMGLPDLSFLNSKSLLHRYRIGLAVAMMAGLVGFILGITSFPSASSTHDYYCCCFFHSLRTLLTSVALWLEMRNIALLEMCIKYMHRLIVSAT